MVEIQENGVSGFGKVTTDKTNPNREMIIVNLCVGEAANEGTPVRFWLQDGRFVCDLPGVDGAFFHIQEGTNHIEINS